jgi:hypothetical protein
MFNPLKYRYRATFIGEEGEDVFLQVTRSGNSQILRFPKNLLPPDLDMNKGLQISLNPDPQSEDTDIETLKSLLQELIG